MKPTKVKDQLILKTADKGQGFNKHQELMLIDATD